jgi:hypothetical protein
MVGAVEALGLGNLLDEARRTAGRRFVPIRPRAQKRRKCAKGTADIRTGRAQCRRGDAAASHQRQRNRIDQPRHRVDHVSSPLTKCAAESRHLAFLRPARRQADVQSRWKDATFRMARPLQ